MVTWHLFFQPIKASSALRELKSFKINKGAGLDNIPPCLLKATADIIAPSLTYIFNLVMTKGIFPQGLKVAKVTPLFKSGAKDQVENYCPISILPIVVKIFEKEVQILDGQKSCTLLSARFLQENIDTNSLDKSCCCRNRDKFRPLWVSHGSKPSLSLNQHLILRTSGRHKALVMQDPRQITCFLFKITSV